MALQLNGTTKIVNDNLNTEVKTLFTPKNWIINGGFDVWQRGTSVVVSTGDGYGADRWFTSYSSSGTSVTISRQTFAIGQVDVPNSPTYYMRLSGTSGASEGKFFGQRIEKPYIFANKTMTLSYWAKSSSSMSLNFHVGITNTGSTVIVVPPEIVNFTTSWTKYTRTFTVPSLSGLSFVDANHMRLQWYPPNSTTFQIDIANVSLVEGSTPVEWQTEAYADVLRQCQRYYVRFNALNAFTRYGVGDCATANIGSVVVNFQTIMRISPTSVDYAGNLAIQTTSSTNAVSSIAISTSGSSNVVGFLDCQTSGLTAGRTALLISNNNTTSYIGFNAEL